MTTGMTLQKAGLSASATIMLALFSVGASAADSGAYVFGGAGQVSAGSDQQDIDSLLTSAGASGFSSSISNATLLTLEAGYKVNKYFAVEGGFVGSISDETYSATVGGASFNANLSTTGAKVVAVGLLPLTPQFDLFGKLGGADLRTSVSFSGSNGAASASASTSGTKFGVTYGVGAAWNATSQIAVRVDVDRYTLGLSGSTSNRTAWTLGAQYTF